MANDYRDRNRGMFGYEGEGFMRGNDEDVPRRGYDRDEAERSRYRGYDIGHRDDFPTGFAGGYGTDVPRGYRNVESGRQSFRGRGPKNYTRSDDRIREDVCERLTMDHDVDASEIEVNVASGAVTLTGTVDNRHAKRRAEDLAESVAGVTDVQNQIRISRGTEAGQS
jgi:BON domain